MLELEAYRDELELIFGEASEEIARLPAGLRDSGQALLAGSHPLRGRRGANVISYLLPYWLGEQAGSSIELCRQLAVGNIYGMLHFFLLDDAMDGGVLGRDGLRGSLALGQLLHGLFLERYRSGNPDPSPLWVHYRRYLDEWASAVSRETGTPMNPADPVQLAGKAAPVKLCAAALLVRAGQRERLPGWEQAVGLALAVLQLSDDWADWREDLAEPHCNAFLTIARDMLSLPAEAPLEEHAVKRAIYSLQGAARLAGIAEGYAERLRRMADVPARLAQFTDSMARGLRHQAEVIEESTSRLALGGGIGRLLENLQE